jgi:hypothetical protein
MSESCVCADSPPLQVSHPSLRLIELKMSPTQQLVVFTVSESSDSLNIQVWGWYCTDLSVQIIQLLQFITATTSTTSYPGTQSTQTQEMQQTPTITAKEPPMTASKFREIRQPPPKRRNDQPEAAIDQDSVVVPGKIFFHQNSPSANL